MPSWPEVDSRVYLPYRWLFGLVGILFVGLGAFGYLFADQIADAGDKVRATQWFFVAFGVLGAMALILLVRGLLWPVSVRHAAAVVLPDVPHEPVAREGSIAHQQLWYALAESDDGWEFRPQTYDRPNGKLLLFGLAVPFFLFFVGGTAWAILRVANIEITTIVIATVIALALASLGAVYLLIFLVARATSRRLCRLSIPRNGGDLTLDTLQQPTEASAVLAAGLQWVFVGPAGRQLLTIPRARIAAVQLCPWYRNRWPPERRSDDYVAQGLLVLSDPADPGIYHRLPFLLTGDLSGAARLMRQLADVLQVPYLFHADAEGWHEEFMRSTDCPPL